MRFLPKPLYKINHNIILFLLLALALKAGARNFGDSTIARYYFADGKFNKQPVDTGIYEFQRYNPVFQGNNFMAWNGNLGLQSTSVFFKANHEIGFDPGTHAYDLITFQNKNYRYYDVKRPVSEVFYINGFGKEQQVSLFHTQNIQPNWNAGFNFVKTRSEGMFNRQQSNNSNFTFFTSYHTKDQRYRLFGNYIRNKIFIQENGGVNDTSFVEFGFNNKKAVQVNLLNAFNARKNNNFNLTQYYFFGRVNSGDSAFRAKNYAFYISHSASLNNMNIRYEDKIPSTSFYDTLLIDQYITIDTMRMEQLEQNIMLATAPHNLNGEKRLLNYGISFSEQKTKIRQLYKKSDELFYYTLVPVRQNTNDIAKGFVNYNQKALTAAVNGSYVLNGYNKNDMGLNAQMNYSFNDSLGKARHWLALEYSYSARQAEYFRYYYLSNSYNWYNANFKKQSIGTLSLKYIHVKWQIKAEANIHTISNYLYFDTLAISRQADRNIMVCNLLLHKDFKVGKFHLNNRVAYQYTPQSYYLRLPDFMLRHSLYYENSLFKKALQLQVGFDLNYYSSYYGYAFMPATSQYYLQDKKIIGNYPFFDFFVNAIIGRARIFFKSEHMNAGFYGNSYYNLYQYPHPDRSIYKIGISWSLLN